MKRSASSATACDLFLQLLFRATVAVTLLALPRRTHIPPPQASMTSAGGDPTIHDLSTAVEAPWNSSSQPSIDRTTTTAMARCRRISESSNVWLLDPPSQIPASSSAHL